MSYSQLWKGFCAVLVAIALILIQPDIVLAAVNPQEVNHMVQAIEDLDTMRSGLASTIDPGSEMTPEKMQVCKPVAIQAKELSAENGWQVKQIAKKYRNPDHAPQSLLETTAIAKFEQDPELLSFSQTAEDGLHYYRRINVDSSCLACHGPKNNRPNFIKAAYLKDLAYDFKTGDLRGMYSVLIPTLEDINDES